MDYHTLQKEYDVAVASLNTLKKSGASRDQTRELAIKVKDMHDQIHAMIRAGLHKKSPVSEPAPAAEVVPEVAPAIEVVAEVAPAIEVIAEVAPAVEAAPAAAPIPAGLPPEIMALPIEVRRAMGFPF